MRVFLPFCVALPVLAGVCLAAGYVYTQAPEETATPPPGSLPPAAAANSAAPAPGREAAKDGSVWGALVYASVAKPGEAKLKDPEDFPSFSKRLSKVFSTYDRFEVIGQHTQVVFREYESWVVPSRDLFLKLDSKGTTQDGALNLHIQFWKGQKVAVKTDTVLRPRSPLFIEGPKWRDGQLIFVLELKADPDSAKD